MLVLSRKCGQTIVLPQSGVTFTVLEIESGRVRVGVSAPPGVIVHREEVWQRIEASGSRNESKRPADGRAAVGVGDPLAVTEPSEEEV